VPGVACFKASAKHIGHGFPLPAKQALYFPEPTDAGDSCFVEVIRHGETPRVMQDLHGWTGKETTAGVAVVTQAVEQVVPPINPRL
jgi:hypothetical protein